MIVRARAPMRIGIGGGGTDVSPYCDMHGGSVINAAIALYAYATLEPLEEGTVQFHALETDEQATYSLVDVMGDARPSPGLSLLWGVYRRIVSQYNGGKPLSVGLRTFTEAPPGSGLGSSSALVVAIVCAFAEYLRLPLGEYEVAHLAYEIERKDLGLAGGRQDQYAATFGGFNFMEFYGDERVIVNPLRMHSDIVAELEARLLLCFSGVSRESAHIIATQSANVRQSVQSSIEAMHEVKREAVVLKEALLKGDFAQMADALNRGWAAKRRMAEGISNPKIDELCAAAQEAGALATKVSGAGGGGFIMVLCEPRRRLAVKTALIGRGGEVRECGFTRHGARAWRVTA